MAQISEEYEERITKMADRLREILMTEPTDVGCNAMGMLIGWVIAHSPPDDRRSLKFDIYHLIDDVCEKVILKHKINFNEPEDGV